MQPAGDDYPDFGVNSGWGWLQSLQKDFQVSFLVAPLPPRMTNGPYSLLRSFKIDPIENEIDDVSNFANGVHVKKWTNNYTSGAKGNDITGNFVDTDFPISDFQKCI